MDIPQETGEEGGDWDLWESERENLIVMEGNQVNQVLLHHLDLS